MGKKEEQEVAAILGAEAHDSNLTTADSTVPITGFDDIPTSMLPLPFVKLVQPGSTGVELADGKEAQPGTFFMNDSKVAVESLRFANLRSKRQVQQFTDDNGNQKTVVRIGLLGMHLETLEPFILGIPVSSFNAFGWMVKQFKDRKAKKSWEYAVTLTTEKVETKKMVQGELKMVKFWVCHFDVDEQPIDKDTAEILDAAYQEWAAKLDRAVEEEAEA